MSVKKINLELTRFDAINIDADATNYIIQTEDTKIDIDYKLMDEKILPEIIMEMAEQLGVGVMEDMILGMIADAKLRLK